LSKDVVDDISTDVCRHWGRPNYAGSEDVMRDRRCAHLAPSVTPLEPHASCVVVATRTSRGAACSPAVEVPPASGPRERRRLPAQGHYRCLPSRSGSRYRRPGNHRLYSGSRNHRQGTSRSGSHGHRSHWQVVHRYARYRATAVVARAVANESGWGLKTEP
jgi:hypothetical protein